jgi:hypothetical protein
MTTTGRVLDEIIADCIRKRAQAKELEDQAKTLKEEANTILMLYRTDGSIADKTVELDSVGKITFVTKTTHTLDKDLFKTTLMGAGVAVSIIAAAEKVATTTKESTTPQFTPVKK